MMRGSLRALVTSASLVASVLVVGVGGGAASAAGGPGGGLPPFEVPVCGPPASGHALCNSIDLLQPQRYWHPGKSRTGGSASGLPTSGYYPADLLSAYGLVQAAASGTPGGETIAIVDAYDDPNAASDLAAYRTMLSGATDPNTLLADATIPPLCGSGSTVGCVTFTKVNQSGGSSYPRGNTGWAEEISVDLDMASAVCPDCNIVLVEASSSSFANLVQAVNEAKTFSPAVITNSYGGSEFSSEASYNGVYSAGAGIAMTAAAGDSGYGVEFPAAAPQLTAVGGTTLNYSGSGAALTWNRSVWSGSGSGCSAYEGMPSWQSDQGVYSIPGDCASGRQVADISADANPTTGVAVYDTFHEGGWMVFGGTSVATQIIGAAYAVAAGSGVLRPDPSALYPDAAAGTTGPTPGLAPVTSGSNATCGDYLCDASDALSSGYNGPTGLGTPDGVGALATVATGGTLSLGPTAGTLTAGSPSGQMDVAVSPAAPSTGLTLDLSTTGTGGEFSTDLTTWSHTLPLTIAAGSTQSPAFYYEDPTAGTDTITASAGGFTSGSLSVTVDAGTLASISVSPASATVAEGGTATFTATGEDSYGNPVAINPTWTTSAPGTLSASSGTSTVFTAGGSSGSGSVTATQGGLEGNASVTVTGLATMSVTVTAGSTVKKGPNYRTPLTVSATDANSGSPLDGASAAVDIYQGSCASPGALVASASATTGTNGQMASTFSTRQIGTYCADTTVTDGGYSAGSGSLTFTVPVA